MNKGEKILVLGGLGLVGSAIIRELKRLGHTEILAPSQSELNLLIQSDTLNYFKEHRPDYVFDAAAKVGGIQANNNYRADFIFENLSIQNNLFEAAFKYETKKFLFLGSSCIYPKLAPQPIKEEYLLTGELEPTNEPYAIAKIAGLKMAESFRRQYGRNFFAVMPTNLYGINDNYHKENSHVIPGLIARMSETIKANLPEFEIWGTGAPRREFLYVDDLARACVFLMTTPKELPYWINIGTGEDISIKELATMIAELMNFKGKLVFNTKYPDGTPRKLLDVSKIKGLGWKPEMNLRDGLKESIRFFEENVKTKRQ